MSKLMLDIFKSDLIRISKLEKIKPYEVTKRLYFERGGKLTEWEVRKLGGFSYLLQSLFKEDILNDTEVRLAGTKMKVKKEASLLTRSLDSLGLLDYILERIKETVSTFTPLKPPAQLSKPQKKQKIDRIVNIVLSDHHIGSDILQSETGHSFGKIEEARALAFVAKQVATYKPDKRETTSLNVLMLGDIIENQLHGQTTADLLHLQACRAIWLYPQLFAYWAMHFKKITVYFAVGNHGRDKYIHPNRATSLKFNALETTIYYAIRQALKHYKNITFVQPTTPWVEFKLFNARGYATHGDTHFHVGNPGVALNIKNIENQINKINASLRDDDEYKIFVVGHVHQPLVTQLQNNTYLVVNGALLPPNAYAQSVNILEAPQVQILWESTPDFPIGDIRFIWIKDYEHDNSLNEIIKPFEGL